MIKWTEEDKAIIKTMWMIEGKSANKIAEHFNVSRDAIIGIARRNKFKREKPTKLSDTNTWSAPVNIEPISNLNRGSEAVFSLRPHQCRYSFGVVKDDDFYFCENETEEGLSWCKEHYNLVYEKRKLRSNTAIIADANYNSKRIYDPANNKGRF